MKVKSVSFYQAVKLGDGSQHNTVYLPTEGSTDIKYKGVEIYFKNGLMAVSGKECNSWKPQNKNKVYFIGITNIRCFEVEKEELEESPFEFMLGEKKVQKVEGPNRQEMMEFLKEKEIKFPGNISNENLTKLYKEHKENNNE